MAHLGSINTSRITDMNTLFGSKNPIIPGHPERMDYSGIETWDVSHVTVYTLQELLDAGLLDPAALKRHLKKKGRAVSGLRIPKSVETRR